jgi:hypothetical protein
MNAGSRDGSSAASVVYEALNISLAAFEGFMKVEALIALHIEGLKIEKMIRIEI